MTPQRIFGFILIALGIAGLVIGMNSSHSLVDQLSNTFTGHFTDHTTWYLIGGLVAGIAGLGIVLFSGEARNPRNN